MTIEEYKRVKHGTIKQCRYCENKAEFRVPKWVKQGKDLYLLTAYVCPDCFKKIKNQKDKLLHETTIYGEDSYGERHIIGRELED